MEAQVMAKVKVSFWWLTWALEMVLTLLTLINVADITVVESDNYSSATRGKFMDRVEAQV